MERTTDVPCWSCGELGTYIAGQGWMRECKTCDVTWNAKPVAPLVRGR